MNVALLSIYRPGFVGRMSLVNELPPPEMRVSRHVTIVASVIASIAFLVYVFKISVVVDGRRYFLLGDDAMISMRYAWNLAHGRGLGWNAGEHVQGYTNLGWTLIMAACHLLPLPDRVMALLVQLIALAAHLMTALYVYRHLERRGKASAGALAAGVILFNGSMLTWGIVGFESGLQALFITLAFLRTVPIRHDGDEQIERNWGSMPIWAAAAFFVRADALSLFILAVALSIARQMLTPYSRRPAATIRGIVIGAAIVLGILAFQKHYYGDWLPNTVRLKTSGDTRDIPRGLKYLMTFAVDDGQLILFAGPIYLMWGAIRSASRGVYIAPACLVGGWAAYVAFVGGDAFPLSRFMIPLIPILAACTALLISETMGSRADARQRRTFARRVIRRGLTVLAVTALMIWYVIPPARFLNTMVRSVRRYDITCIYAANTLRHQLRPGATIGVYLAGVVPYIMPDYRFHDMLGKSDRRIAASPAHWGPAGHNKWDYDYSLGQVKPAALVTAANYTGASDSQMRWQVQNRVDFGFNPALWLDPTFQKYYRPHRVNLKHPGKEPAPFDIYLRGSEP